MSNKIEADGPGTALPFGPVELAWLVTGTTGTTGEYSDRGEWPVCVYPTLAMAEEHVRLSREWMLNNLPVGGERALFNLGYEERQALCKRNPYDPHMQLDYTGTSWFVSPVAVRNELPDAGGPTGQAAQAAVSSNPGSTSIDSSQGGV